ncbi:major facilitator superfamily domain-containing protein [Aspergillus lucknowensis]|uniref:Major facilitator superfamily domain-containing protein n=1 Tax=Aspergillus lucknowensis TaxID=176173 RepID=A0ABR4LIG6_9EURO
MAQQHRNTEAEALEKDIEAESRDVQESGSVPEVNEKLPWWTYFWDRDATTSKEERKFLRKLDVFLMTMLSLGYFIKGLDQANIGTAFVSGMQEDLQMYGKQLNLVDTSWTIGYIVGIIPSQLILTKVRVTAWIPACEVLWTVLTFTLASCKTADQVIGVRFLIGLAESVFYPAAHLILGSWYKPSELGKRAGILYAVGSAAGMFSGYLQIAVYENLNGTMGYKGWQWLFIMDGVISLPIALAGFWLFPDFPHNTRAFYLNEADREMARTRMERIGRAPVRKLGWGIVKRVFGRWHVYPLTALYVIFSNNGSSNSVNPLTLWLETEGWSVSSLNLLPTGQAGVQLVSSLVFAFLSDFWRNRPIFLSITAFLGLFTSICLAVWDTPVGLRWFSLFLNRAAVPFGPLLLVWTNEICSRDAEERAVVIGIMNAAGYAFNAWLPLLTYPQTDRPRFHKGWIWSSVAFSLQVVAPWGVDWFYRREGRGRGVAGGV